MLNNYPKVYIFNHEANQNGKSYLECYGKYIFTKSETVQKIIRHLSFRQKRNSLEKSLAEIKIHTVSSCFCLKPSKSCFDNFFEIENTYQVIDTRRNQKDSIDLKIV